MSVRVVGGAESFLGGTRGIGGIVDRARGRVSRGGRVGVGECAGGVEGGAWGVEGGARGVEGGARGVAEWHGDVAGGAEGCIGCSARIERVGSGRRCVGRRRSLY